MSDIHLRDYHRFNKFLGQRLQSFPEYAKDVVEIGKKHNIDTLLIGGDIVDKNTLTPKELHALFEMFNILTKQFRIYSIIGNHDAKSKKDIDKEDTVITLLEEMDNISFHHQEILTIGGRTIAFENWMPEYKLDWYKGKVDLYISHATIDYNQTGMYGMDTSVFEDRFTYGLFGDIHVTSQLDNYISIGNTKQESLSDRDQGGVMIFDLEDLTYERIPIDPEHKKYLHLVKTTEEDEEGWVDFEGESMVYKVYRPEKVKGEAVEFTIPEVSDITAKLDQIMVDLDLTKLHKDIKEATDYTPIDFNFKLNKLKVHNFRSIDDYVLDFSDDYMITGHNGSGKSTLITALFYALIGKKTLKQDIRFGEKEAHLEVFLTYQKKEYIIRRGTATGDYGLTVDGKALKYNTKLEFEKDVYEHLPFLHYHESFFFNYWDTELLGSMKLDRRFDLLAKFYRLDALADYNDLATAKLKVEKKKLKEVEASLSTNQILLTAKGVEVEALEEELQNKPKREECEKLIEDYTKLKDLKEEKDGLNKTLESLSSYSEKFEKEYNNVLYSYESQRKAIDTSRDKDELQKLISDYKELVSIKNSIEKGESLIKSSNELLVNYNRDLNYTKEQLDGLGTMEAKKFDAGLASEMIDLQDQVTKKTQDFMYKKMGVTSALDENSAKLGALQSELESEKNKPEEEKKCSQCGSPISNEKTIELLQERINAAEIAYNQAVEDHNDFVRGEQSHNNEIQKLKDRIDELNEEKTQIERHNLKVEQHENQIQRFKNDIETIETNIKNEETTNNSYRDLLDDYKSKLSKFDNITEEEFYQYKLNLDKLNDLDKLSVELKESKDRFEEAKKELEANSKTLTDNLSVIEKLIGTIGEITEDQRLQASLLLSTYSNWAKEVEKLDKLNSQVSQMSTEFEKQEKIVKDLDAYCQVTSRSGEVLKSTLEDITKTFSSGDFRFTTNRAQASGKVVTDMSVEYLVGKRWVPYSALSSGQKTLCDLYYISKVVTGVGIVSFDETLRFLDEENLKVAADLIASIKKQNLLVSSHSSNLSLEGSVTLKCELDGSSTTKVETIV